MKFLLFTIFIFTNLLFSNAFSLARTLQNKIFSLEYFYWFDKEDSVYYLTKQKKDKTYSIWSFTSDRKWKPYHNTSKFDGFPEAKKVLVSVDRDGKYMYIQKEQCKSDNSNKDTCGRKEYLISHYFWLNSSNIAFLLKQNEVDISIWRFTQDKKWQPVHNAKAFDGFPEAERNLLSAKLDIEQPMLTTGKAVSAISRNFDLSLESNNLGNGNSLTATFLDLSPHLSWDFNLVYKDRVSNFVYQIKTDDGQIVYSTVLGADKRMSEVSRGNIYSGILPRSSFCETSFYKYEKPKIDKVEDEKQEEKNSSIGNYTIGYNLSLYPIEDTSNILNNVDCVNLISKAEHHITKNTIKATLFTDATVQTIGQIDESTDEDKRGVFLGEVIFTFFPTKINRLPLKYNKYITMDEIPPGLIPVFKDIGDYKIKLSFDGVATFHEGSHQKVKITFNKDMFATELEREQYTSFTMTFSHNDCQQ